MNSLANPTNWYVGLWIPCLQWADDLGLDNQVWSIRSYSRGFRLLSKYDSEEHTEEPRTLGYDIFGRRVFARH